MKHKLFSTAFAVMCGGILLFAVPAAAEPRTSSDLLLPYFEVDLDGPRTTLFSVGNAQDQPAQVRVSVDTNWGIAVLGVTLNLDAGQVVTVNLRDWIERGELPTRNLGPLELDHVQAAFSGRPSPKDGLYYGSEVEPGLAVGYVTLRILGHERPKALWGDYFWIDPAGDLAEGELLVDVGLPAAGCGLCDRHVARFLEGGASGAGTELVVWTGRRTVPSPTPVPQLLRAMISGEAFYRESGVKFDERALDLLPTQVIPLSGLGLSESAGWIDIVTEGAVYVGVRYRAADRFAIAIQSWCVEAPPPAPEFRRRPAIDLQKLTAGFDADSPPGPALEIGTPVDWQYVVTNTGNERLTGIVVSDNRGVAVSCPRTALGAGERMVCTGSGTVAAGQYGNIGTVTGNPPEGPPVSDSDPSHYVGVEFARPGEPAVVLEKLTNGQDADLPPGPAISQGSPVTWTYVVTNVGGVELTGVTVTDDDPAVSVSCPKTVLAIGESMICTAGGTAGEGAYSNVGSVTASGGGETVSASDPSHYFGLPEVVVDLPGIRIEKLTNGFDADGVGSAPHLVHGDPVTWTYIVTNTGSVALSDVTVTDDKGVDVSCPTTTLDPGESMVCTGSGSAVASSECYCNVGLVVASPPEGDDVTDSDPSHYCAEPIVGEAAIHLEKATNGQDADLAPGPSLSVGDNVQWTYLVTNTGDIKLVDVAVTDDQGVAVTCPKTVLDVGESMTCQGNGAAEAGQYANLGTATGTPEGGGDPVADSDPSHYFGEEAPAGDQGCTPGYWKNHTGEWAATGFATGQTVGSVFSGAAAWPAIDGSTLLAALDFGGGPGVEDKARVLLRAAVAAVLNASHPDVAYPRSAASVIAEVNAALATGDGATIEALKDALDSDNNLGCPLS